MKKKRHFIFLLVTALTLCGCAITVGLRQTVDTIVTATVRPNDQTSAIFTVTSELADPLAVDQAGNPVGVSLYINDAFTADVMDYAQLKFPGTANAKAQNSLHVDVILSTCAIASGILSSTKHMATTSSISSMTIKVRITKDNKQGDEKIISVSNDGITEGQPPNAITKVVDGNITKLILLLDKYFVSQGY